MGASGLIRRHLWMMDQRDFTGCPEYPNFGRPGNFEDTPKFTAGPVKFITCQVCTRPCCTRRGPGTDIHTIVASKTWKNGQKGSLGQKGAFLDATPAERAIWENAFERQVSRLGDWLLFENQGKRRPLADPGSATFPCWRCNTETRSKGRRFRYPASWGSTTYWIRPWGCWRGGTRPDHIPSWWLACRLCDSRRGWALLYSTG